MALQGTLEDFGIADIFQLIGQQQKTGVLVLTRKEHTIQIYFHNGNIISAETKHRDQSERLGQMMVQAGLITEEQLQVALESQKKTLQKLGSILIENKQIQKTELDEFIYLQTKETIFRLFRWNSGNYQFHQQDVPSQSEFFQPISAEHILMDGFRIIDEWPAIRKKIGSFETIFVRNKSKKLNVKGKAAGSDFDMELDAAFSGMDGAEGDLAEPLTPAAERVYGLVDGRRDVQTVIAMSRLGEFEACQGLVSLLDQGYIQPGKQSAKAKEKEKRKIALYQDYGQRKNWVQHAPTFLYYSGFLVIFFALLAYLGMGPFAFLQQSSRKQIRTPFFRELISEYQMDRLETALEVYFLKKGFYPKSLRELEKMHLVHSRDLYYPWKNRYQYSSNGSSFRLSKPFQ